MRLIWRLYPTYLIIICLSLCSAVWITSRTIHSTYYEVLKQDLIIRANVVKHNLALKDQPLEIAWVDPLCVELSKTLQSRITVILINGDVIGESDTNPSEMENHRDRAEIQEAIRSGIGMSIRYSRTLQKNMMYVAAAIKENNQVIGVARTSLPATSFEKTLNSIYYSIAIGGILIAIMSAIISLIFSRKITQPIEQFKKGAERFSRGDFNTKLSIPRSEELAALAKAMNRMGMQLDNRLRTIIQQKNQQEAIFSSMVEGVLAISHENRIITLNRTVAECFGIALEQSIGKSILEVINHDPLIQFIQNALDSEKPIEGEIEMDGESKRYFQAKGAALMDSEERPLGAVIVLNDITRLRRLEVVRSEFVANVSHELKTPITSIKGFVETLLDGALNDEENAKRFLRITLKQSDRLNSIIEDLLSLSRIEKEKKHDAIELFLQPLAPIIHSSIDCCRQKASEKHISIQSKGMPSTKVVANAQLLEQAVINLIDNAIKYSDANAEIRVEWREDDNGMFIQVIDQGVGIADEHIPRLFERFYRIDKARSRNLGGTGLGLAIVKHIAYAHKGGVSVDSEFGRGSIFTIKLPRAVNVNHIQSPLFF